MAEIRTVPERVCQAEAVLPGWLRNGSAGRSHEFFRLRWSRGTLRSARCLCFGARLGCRRYGKLQSFFSDRDCSQLIPSQGTAHDYREQLGPVL